MELVKLAGEPQLIEVVLDQEHIVEKYGEPVTFFTFDRLPLDTFMKLSEGNESVGEMIEIVKPLMLDADGKMILQGDAVLPTGVLSSAIKAIIDKMGKL